MSKQGRLLFLRYASPVIDDCSHSPIEDKEKAEYEEMLKTGRGAPSQKRLEEIFPDGTSPERLSSWNIRDVRDYWLIRHNQIKKDNILCQVHLFTVSEFLPANGNELYRVRFSEENISLIARSYIPLEEGNRVTVHGPQVAEIFTDELAERYGGYF